MNFNSQGTAKRNKKTIIVGIILWLILTIVFVVPLAFSIYAATLKGPFNTTFFIEKFSLAITMPFDALGEIFKRNAIGVLISTEFVFTIIYSIIFFIGFVKTSSKHEYLNIEHGSSDWSKHGEQYRILHKNQGIILAENNYLPVDKRGNVNVLVVGRIRFW